MTTKIVKCTCNNDWQDETYGYKNRVANEMKNGQFRCSVCSTIVGSQSIAVNVKKEPVVEVKPVKVAPEKKVAGDKKGKTDDKPAKKMSVKGGKR
jgi:hypothetical protein